MRQMADGDLDGKSPDLIEHNMRLVAHVAKKYYGSGEDPEDLVSIGTIGLLKAVDTYDGAKGYKLVTYAARCIDNELLMYFRGRKKQAKDVSLFEPIGSDKEGNQISLYDILEQEPMDIAAMMDQQNDLLRLRYILPQVLNAREQEIICKRYGIGRTKCGDAKRDRRTVRDFPFLCIKDREKSLGKITRGSFEKFIIIS